MPKINRIRIVNFSYNDNNRHIIDETFNFYGGENALLSLANGGGKSVLVQAMLQPILPKITMLGRKFSDFFQGRSNEPTYIMIEWKLDNGVGYLITGIAISQNANYSANEDDQNSDIRYYTFMKSYDEANNYDISHIPVTEEKNNRIKIASYMEFNKLLKKEADKRDKNFFVFNSQREEQKDYERRLSSYNISKDEWKELMVKINDNEYGVSEVFSQCKTSKAVMDKWIIRYIEKVLNKSQEGDHKKLENMMFQVAQSMVANENHIKDYNIINQFLLDVEEMDKVNKEVISKLDIEDKFRSRLVDGYQSLLAEEESLKQLIIFCDDNIHKLKKELEVIALEETSKEIHKIDLDIKEIDKLLKSIYEIIQEITLKKQDAIYNHKTQIAAEKYLQLKDKNISKARLNEIYLNASKNEDQLVQDMNKVQYTLKLRYEELLTKYIEDIRKLKENKSLKEVNLDSNNNKLSELQNQINDIREELGEVRTEIKIFEKEEAAIWGKLNISLYRNALLKELDKVEVGKINKLMIENIEKAKKNIELDQTKLINFDQDIISQDKELIEIRNKKEDSKLEFVIINKDIKLYEKEKAVILSIVNNYRLSEADIFNKDYIIKRIIEKKDEWLNKEFLLKNNSKDIEKIINGIRDGVSYLPDSLLSILRDKDIPIYTGELYLRKLDEGKKEELLKNNPLLPYSIIVTEKEYNILIEAMEDKDITSIIPIIKYNHREEIYKDSNTVKFLSHPKSINVENKDIEDYIIGLNIDLDTIQQEIEEALRVIEECNKEYQLALQFNYSKDVVEEFYLKKKDMEVQIEELENIEINTVNEIKQLTVTKDNTKELINSLNKTKERDENRLIEFEDYLLKDKGYTLNLIKEIESNGNITTATSNINKLQKERISITNEKSEIEEKIRNKESLKNIISIKFNGVSDAGITEILVGSLEELEGRLISYESKRGQELSRIIEQIRGLEQDIKIINNDIDELKLTIEDYVNVIFSKELKDKYQNENNLLEREEINLDNKSREYTRKIDKLSGRREILYNNLKGQELIQIEKIMDNFKERTTKANKEIFLNENAKSEHTDKEKKVMLSKSNVEYKIPSVKNFIYNENAKQIDNIINYIEVLINDYQLSCNSSNKEIDTFNKISNSFKYKNNNIEQTTARRAFESIIAHIGSLDRSYDKYYYLYERFQAFIKSLNDYKSVMDEKMKLIEHSQRDLIEHAFMEAVRIYDEIPKVSENSTVEIDGVRRKILDIKYEEMQDKVISKEKMHNYINECLNSLIATIKSEADEGKIRREIEKNIATRELLNVISNLDRCIVKSYKVDINEKNRKMRTWEEVIVKNSGAEKFMAYFSLLVALISYSRRSMRGSDIFGKKEESKVLIMDNPFGAITSGHLLKPLFDIAEKYNTQLICLSDIKQGSVINSFNLVYMIKIRQNMMKEDFIEVEPILKNELNQDEKLEKAYLYTSVEQMNLFN